MQHINQLEILVHKLEFTIHVKGYQNVFIPKIIVFFRTALHKMKINTELCCKRYDALTKKTQNYRYRNYCPG